MAYECECGNTGEFLEVFQVAIDAVDGNGNFVESVERDVAFYRCRECDREIDYKDFIAMIDSLVR